MNANRESWRLAWPLILSNLSVPLLGVVDTAVMGHLDSPRYLGGVALGALVMSVLYWMFGFLRMGTTALTAQAFGARDLDETRAALGRAMLVGAGLGLLVILLGPVVVAWAERLFAPTPEVATEFERYLLIRLFGAPAALANMVVLGWFLGLQDARRPLALMIATNGINALLALWLVLGLGLATPGVATATVLAEYSGLALGLWLLRPLWRRQGGWPGWSALLVADRFRRLLAVNRDLFLRSLLLEAAFLAFAAVGSRQGEVVLAANAVLMNFLTVAAYGLDGFAHAAEAMVGRSVGAGDRTGFRAAVRASFANAALLALAMTVAFMATGGWAVRLMTGLPEVQAQALAFLPYVWALPLVSVWAFVYDGVYFGATRTAELRNGMVLALAMFGVTALVLVPPWGNHGLWLSMLLFMAARALVLGVIYRRIERIRPFVPLAGSA
ncbi:MAG: MATE family efflux transporter [Geminicoccaceae bacterium]